LDGLRLIYERNRESPSGRKGAPPKKGTDKP